ncbi:cytosine permease [Ferrimonas marina]|uniref:Cytosine permease n=1 Tax=Ferrimonas marina TaxID=299255 RepID=A0A1M5MEM7_9GAMM|nr:cytosine permease [Ferrimonas marina]SHG75765.1 cytosine permease [Ferrimonas marina]
MSADTEYGLEPVPSHARKPFLSLTLVMLGLTFFSASMWTGGALGTGLDLSQFLWAVLLGNLLLGAYTATLGYIGAKTGLSTHLLARYSFGVKGSWLPSALLGGTQVGWFGVGVAMFAYPVQKFTGADAHILVMVAGLAMTATVYFGISALMVLSAIAVPAIAVLGGYSVYLASDSIGGWSAFAALTPEEPIDFNLALAMVVGSFISAGTLTADFVRYGRSPKAAVLITLIAFFIGNSLMFLFGAAGAAATGQADISEVMVLQGLLVPAIIVLGLNIWTTNDNALYASGLGFANITGFDAKSLSMLNGLLGTLFAMWLYHNFVGWLTFLSAAIPPIGGVLIADYLLNRARYRDFANAQFASVRWSALAAVAIGVGAGHLLPGVVPINAVLAAAASFVLLSRLEDTRAQTVNSEGA